MHCLTDNSAYDMSLQSVIAWGKYLRRFPSSYYLSIAGTSYENTSWMTRLLYFLPNIIFRHVPTEVEGIDTSHWMDDGYDGLLSYYTQTVPKLTRFPIENIEHGINLDKEIKPGFSYVLAMKLDHLGKDVDAFDSAWIHACKFAMAAGARSLLSSASNATNEDRIDHLSRCPDQQIPLWTASKRVLCRISIAERLTAFAILCTGVYFCRDFFVDVVGSLALYCTIVTNPSSGGAISSLLVWAFCIFILAVSCSLAGASSWMLLTISASMKLLYFFVYYRSFTGTCNLYSLLWTIEIFFLIVNVRNYEYLSPISRAILISTFALLLTNSAAMSSCVFVLVALDGITLSSSIGWFFCYAQEFGCRSAIFNPFWIFMWIVFLLNVGFLVYALCSFAQTVAPGYTFLTILLSLYITFNRLRDLSDAYQVYSVKNYYSDESISERFSVFSEDKTPLTG